MSGWISDELESKTNGSDGKAGIGGERVGVAFIGDGYRRAYAKRLLEERVEVAAELASERRVHLLPKVSPEVIVLDCASEGVNPFVALPRLAEIEGSLRIVVLTDESISDGAQEEALISLGADAAADIHDSRAVVEAVSRTGSGSDGAKSPRRKRSLAAA